MSNRQVALRKSRTLHKPAASAALFVIPASVPTTEPKGVVYTKNWVVELLLDLAGYRPDKNLVDAVAVEPAAGDGAFLGPMIERLMASYRRSNRPVLDCRNALVA